MVYIHIEAIDIKEDYMKKRLVTSCCVFHQTRFYRDDQMEEEMIGARSLEKCKQKSWLVHRNGINGLEDTDVILKWNKYGLSMRAGFS